MNPRKKFSSKNPLDIGFTLSLLLKGLLLLTVLDVILIVLTVLEYRNMKLDAKKTNSAN